MNPNLPYPFNAVALGIVYESDPDMCDVHCYDRDGILLVTVPWSAYLAAYEGSVPLLGIESSLAYWPSEGHVPFAPVADGEAVEILSGWRLEPVNSLLHEIPVIGPCFAWLTPDGRDPYWMLDLARFKLAVTAMISALPPRWQP